MIGGTVEHLDRADVSIQRAMGFSRASARRGGAAGDVRVRRKLSTDGRPTVVDRIRFGVVVRIKFVSDADSFLIAHALELERLGLGSGESRKQQAGENGEQGE